MSHAHLQPDVPLLFLRHHHQHLAHATKARSQSSHRTQTSQMTSPLSVVTQPITRQQLRHHQATTPNNRTKTTKQPHRLPNHLPAPPATPPPSSATGNLSNSRKNGSPPKASQTPSSPTEEQFASSAPSSSNRASQLAPSDVNIFNTKRSSP